MNFINAYALRDAFTTSELDQTVWEVTSTGKSKHAGPVRAIRTAGWSTVRVWTNQNQIGLRFNIEGMPTNSASSLRLTVRPKHTLMDEPTRRPTCSAST